MNVIGTFNGYVLYPIPLGLILQWFFYGMIQFIIIGIVAASVYKRETV